MAFVRPFVFIAVAIFAVITGALFALPVQTKEYVKVQMKDTSLIAEVAADPQSRADGLSGRSALGISSAMVFVFHAPARYSMWMKNMLFPLDFFWIRNGKIVDMRENIQPPSRGTLDDALPVYTPDASADIVIETNAGFAHTHEIVIGDDIKVFFDSQSIEQQLGSAYTPASAIQGAKPALPPGFDYYIETLRKKPAEGKNFTIERELATLSAYKKYLISYKSGDLTISGVMNVPLGTVPKDGFPILILNHGLIGADVYFPGRGSKREQDYFAKHGYVTIHPDYRGLGESSPNPNLHHDFYVGYTQDVINLLDAVKAARMKSLDTNRIGMWGHSMGGGITARVMVLRPDIRAFVLFAPIPAEVQGDFYELSQSELSLLARTYGVGEAADAIYKKISPLTYFADVQAPVQLHHGLNDTDVPLDSSQQMYDELVKDGKKVEFFKYPGEKHEFINLWSVAAQRSLQFFDKYVKNAR